MDVQIIAVFLVLWTYTHGYDILLKVSFGVFCVECRVRHVLANGPLRPVHGGAQRGTPDRVQTLAATVVLKKNTHMYHKNNVKIAWSRKRLLCGWVGAFIVFLSPPPYFLCKIVTVIPTVTILHTQV